MTKLVVGLGNPGSKYQQTRHNVGFQLVDHVAQKENITFKEDRIFQAEVASFFHRGEKIYLVKPTTFMNRSGLAVEALLAYYGLTAEDLILIYDDLDMAVGKVRLRAKGSAGGHNGIKHIIHLLGHSDFLRFKVGIGRPAPQQSVPNYVLGNFTAEEQIAMSEALERVTDGLYHYLETSDLEATMRRYNG
ncbi:aminoacyl-tRNA hydrolase [Streptococcus danieliae]|uniref:Peptidyl-tRNA hydrolase n=1 Tax=Streptococcus danieliae TaxID=747656 RepID=A0A7X3G832_9STRE|nr:aminoacyl-tRNA hydrolase [Streptococcus danieliae]MVX58131.1 aminoacyl-tRNA hydrolase [Streptococcus danieliae]